MKQLMVVLLMLCPVALMAQTSNAAKDFPLTVKVTSSKIEPIPGNTSGTVRNVDMVNLLRATIGGKKYLLAASIRRGMITYQHPVLIEPGDYPARLKWHNEPNPGEVQQTYELRLPNGKTVLLFLWGMSE